MPDGGLPVFKRLASLLNPYINHAVCNVEDTHIMVAGQYMRKMEVALYSISKNVWTELPQLNYTRNWHSICCLAGKVFVFGGTDELNHGN